MDYIEKTELSLEFLYEFLENKITVNNKKKINSIQFKLLIQIPLYLEYLKQVFLQVDLLLIQKCHQNLNKKVNFLINLLIYYFFMVYEE